LFAVSIHEDRALSCHEGRVVSRDYEPVPGKWYEDLDGEESFQVLAVDPDEEMVTIQWPDR
jgi:hypothetical protein